MKIGVDIRCLMEKNYSGISEYTYNLLTHLLKIDSNNQYFLFYNSAQASSVPDFNYPNVTIKEFKYPNKLFNLSLKFLKIAEIDRLIGDVDIFLIPNFLFLNLSKGVKKIIVVHDLSFELYPEFFTFKKRLWHELINPKALCHQADQIIAISQNTKQDLINFYNLPPEKISVIHPGISEAFFEQSEKIKKQQAKDKYNLPEKFILSLGNLEPRKNIATLLEAFDKINDSEVHLVIAGGQAWKYKKIYKSLQSLKNKKKIKFLGYVDAQDKPALYANADIFVYPSIYEGFGLPPLESMACGTPVISSFASSLPEAVADAGLLIDPNNINDLVLAINQLFTDKQLRIELSQRGYQRAKNFHWATVAEQILKIIDSVK